MKIKLILAYHGQAFHGWQTQACGLGIQDILHQALEEVAKTKLKVTASGRTDAGVHALGQCVHFQAPASLTMNPYNWVPALNTKLPASIRILEAHEVADDFHARFSAVAKTYRYDLCTDPVLSPFLSGLSWHIPRLLDADVLEQALHAFQGEHDFQAFAALRGHEDSSTDWKRNIHKAQLSTSHHGYTIHVTGNGFLYKMVRLLVGTAVHVAQGRMKLVDMLNLLDQPSGFPFGKSKFCAPADGLYLEKVIYPDDPEAKLLDQFV